MSKPTKPLDIHDRLYSGGLPPPWYRPPPDVVKGPLRTHLSIIAGLVISNDEGRRWFKDFYDYELPRHSLDGNIPIRLQPLLCEKILDVYDCCMAPRRLESEICDFLVITFIQRGPFVHNGPEAYEEVYDEDRKPIPGAKEEEIKERLKKHF
ncbi:hypothetical protein C0991_008295, partial [Blastosporella zonata]